MANHDASQQALGYIYQSQCALYLLLDSEDPDVNVCIEKFDDISFHKEQDPYLQLQVKYHSSNGEITNTSTDFWRTIKAWIDNIQVNPNLLQNTVFCIITTNTIAKDSIIEKIQNKTDSIDNIYKDLSLTNLTNLNVFFTTIERLQEYSFEQALFQLDLSGNLYIFNPSLTERTFSHNILEQRV